MRLKGGGGGRSEVGEDGGWRGVGVGVCVRVYARVCFGGLH